MKAVRGEVDGDLPLPRQRSVGKILTWALGNCSPTELQSVSASAQESVLITGLFNVLWIQRSWEADILMIDIMKISKVQGAKG